MGLKKGRVTFSRFELHTDMPADFSVKFDEMIQKGAFNDLFPENVEKTMGWVGLQKLYDKDFGYANHTVGNYRAFSLRIDKKTVPSALLKMKASEIMRARMAERGVKRLPKNEREDIMESIRAKLLKQAPAVPSMVDVCWSMADGTIYVSSLSEKVLQDFQDLFQTTFDLNLGLLTPWYSVQNNKANKAGEIADPGREFLTWLWFKSDEGGEMYVGDPSDNKVATVAFGKRIAFERKEGDDTKSVVCQGPHVTAPVEGKEALRQGKMIKDAVFSVTDETGEWSLGLKGDTFQFQSVKLPTAEDAASTGKGYSGSSENDDLGEEGVLLERISMIEHLTRTVDALFNGFLKLRLSNDWPAEKQKLVAWGNMDH